MTEAQKTIISFALDFLKSNLDDPEVEAILAKKLGVVEDAEDYEGGHFEWLRTQIEVVWLANQNSRRL